MITKDINFRVKCDALGVSSEDYYKDKIIDEEEKSYKGFVSIEVKEEMSYLIDLFYQEEDVTEDIEDILGRKLHPNEFINIKAGSQSLIGCKVNGKIKKLNSSDKVEEFIGVKPRNREQLFALNLLCRDDVPLVSLTGLAGSGKTFLTIPSPTPINLTGIGNSFAMAAKTPPLAVPSSFVIIRLVIPKASLKAFS